MTQTLVFPIVLGLSFLVLCIHHVRVQRTIRINALIDRVEWAGSEYRLAPVAVSKPEHLSGTCHRHGRPQAPYCSDCIVESVSGLKIRSLSDILNQSL